MPTAEARARRIRDVYFIVGGLAGTVAILAVYVWFAIAGNAATTRNIQQQRAQSILTSCRERNHRNQETSKVVTARAKKQMADADAATRKRILEASRYTLLLIDALAPIENCGYRVFRFTNSQPTTTGGT